MNNKISSSKTLSKLRTRVGVILELQGQHALKGADWGVEDVGPNADSTLHLGMMLIWSTLSAYFLLCRW